MTNSYKLKLGLVVNDFGKFPLIVDLRKISHWLICGGSGSGKSVFCSYIINQLLNFDDLSVYIADFKGSGDFIGISPNYAEFEATTQLIEDFYTKYQEIKQSRTGEHIVLIIDEYAGYLVWLESNDKKKAALVKGMIAEILMQGRSLSGCGSAWVWCIVQRADSTYFSNGVRDNFMLTVGFCRLSKESKTMLGFLAEDIPENYQPCTGRALLLVDGQELSVLQVPHIDTHKLRKLLQKKAEQRYGEAVSCQLPT